MKAQRLSRWEGGADEAVLLPERLPQEDLQEHDRGVGSPRDGDGAVRKLLQRIVGKKQHAHYLRAGGDRDVRAEKVTVGVYRIFNRGRRRNVEPSRTKHPVELRRGPGDETDALQEEVRGEGVKDRDQVRVEDAPDAQRRVHSYLNASMGCSAAAFRAG